MLTFSEEVLLLLLEEDEGIFLSVGKNTLELAMAGAVLMELAFAGRIDTDLQRMLVVNNAPTGDPLLDNVLERMTNSKEINDTRLWIETLAREKTASIQENALASLVERGILKREEKRLFQEAIEHLWIFRSPRYFPVDERSRHNARTRFAELLFTDQIPHPRDLALICLADACGILRAHLADEIDRVAPRIRQLNAMDLIGRQITRAIAAVDLTAIQSMAHPLAR